MDKLSKNQKIGIGVGIVVVIIIILIIIGLIIYFTTRNKNQYICNTSNGSCVSMADASDILYSDKDSCTSKCKVQS